MIEKRSISIEKNKEQPASLDFKSLRQDAISLIQQLSGNVWTDYNLHDPGVTILEMLCVAITDLAYRTDFPIKDLLADKNGHIPPEENSFFSKEDILTTNPVTINDIRKAVLDEITDVYNIWLERVLSAHSSESIKGLYTIYVQITKEAATRMNDEKEANHKEAFKEQIKAQVRKAFISKRNLCEDCQRDIIILEPVEITVNADVTVSEEILPEEILSQIYSGIEEYLNPPVKYYSEDELLEEGFKIEDIYAGPLLKKGFIPDKVMNPRRLIIDPADLMKSMMQKEGVINVKNLTLQILGVNIGSKPYKLDKLNFPHLAINLAAPSIRIFKGKNEVSVNLSIFNDLFRKIQEITKRDFLSSFHKAADKELLKGIYKDVEEYFTIQNHFPLVYGIGEEGLAPGETDARKAQAKQLKAYLMLFEQLMANYLSQLANARHLFSTGLSDKDAMTYYFQPLYNIPGVKSLLKAFTELNKNDEDADWELFKDNKDNSYIKSMKRVLETDDTFRERKNKIFDHLLARFNLQLEAYPATLFNSLYGDPTVDLRVDEVLEWKSKIISNMVELSHDRIKAFNYLDESLTIQDLTGFQKRLTRLLYIHNQKMRPLSWVFDLKKDAAGGIKEVHSLVRYGDRQKSNNPEDRYHENGLTDPYDFGSQTIEIFKNGLNINNYEIVREGEKEGNYQIRFNSSSGKKGAIISKKYADESSASISLKELIRYLKKISIESEGFHIVEHILLRPSLKKPLFGFGFYENKNTLLFRHNQWANFETREKMIGEILDLTTNIKEASSLNDKVSFPTDKENSTRSDSPGNEHLKNTDEKRMENVLENIQLKKNQSTLFFPKFELWVKRLNGSVIKEDYFNFRMAVVLPAWPARFQDDNFREFTEDLFRLNAPAHIRIDFYWLGIFDMKRFEKIYFEWLNFLRKPVNGADNNELSEKLISFLKGDNYHTTVL